MQRPFWLRFLFTRLGFLCARDECWMLVMRHGTLMVNDAKKLRLSIIKPIRRKGRWVSDNSTQDEFETTRRLVSLLPFEAFGIQMDPRADWAYCNFNYVLATRRLSTTCLFRASTCHLMPFGVPATDRCFQLCILSPSSRNRYTDEERMHSVLWLGSSTHCHAALSGGCWGSENVLSSLWVAKEKGIDSTVFPTRSFLSSSIQAHFDAKCLERQMQNIFTLPRQEEWRTRVSQ